MTTIVETHKLNLSDVPIVEALVYNSESNCAQLKRTFPLTLVAGYNEVQILNLPFDIVQDSIRVAGTGAAIIHDVAVKTQEGADFVIPDRVLAIRDNLEEKERVKNEIDDKKTAVNKRIEGLDNLITEAGRNAKEGKFEFDGRTIESLNSLHAYHQDKTVELRAEARRLAEQYRRAEEEYSRASQDYDNTGYRWRTSGQLAAIVVEAEEAGGVELTVTYKVNNVAWFPFYDVRVTSGENAEVHVAYYGKVRQFSGEDWKDVPLVLSTAKPAHGDKQLPKLGALDASIVVPEPENRHQMMYSAAMDLVECAPMGGMARNYKSMRVASASVRSSNIASEFGIGRPATINDRTEEYKVSIGAFTVPAHLANVTVPSRNAVAYLIATAVNSSEYPLVAGQASVFLDGAFVNKVDFEDAVVSQKFEVSLGVDPAIRVEYKPARNYQQQSGTVEKINSQVTEKTTFVTNLRPNAVLLTIREQIPRSTDSRISIRLESPEAVEVAEVSAEPKVGAEITPENILNHTVQLAPGASASYTVKYVTEHPQAEKIRYDEKF